MIAEGWLAASEHGEVSYIDALSSQPIRSEQ
jgi:hypothetical protein